MEMQTDANLTATLPYMRGDNYGSMSSSPRASSATRYSTSG